MKFWELKAENNKSSAEMLIYGSIVGGTKWDETDTDIVEFNEAINKIPEGTKELNMRINSPGGSVFTTLAMMNQLKRLKSEKGIEINAYIDGIGASSASMLPMVADNIYMYENSFMMIHKPLVSPGLSNAVQLKEAIDWLEKTEANTLVPAYKSKGKENLTDEKIQELLNGDDNWLTAQEVNELFNITIVEDKLEMVAHKDFDVIAECKETPQAVKDLLNVNKKQEVKALTDEERKNIIADSMANLNYLKTLNLL